MKLTRLMSSLVALLMCIGPAANYCAAQTTAPASRHYTMIDLIPAGSTTATASGASGAQQVGSAGFPVPTSPGQTETHAVLWSGGADAFTDLGVGTAYAVGDGQQAGIAFNHAALWTGTAASFVDLNPVGWNTSVANGVGGGQQVGTANRQQVCGEKKGGCGSGTYTVMQPFLWTGTAASAVNLTPFNLGYGGGQAYGTDGVQQVGAGMQQVGFGAYSQPFAVLWTGTAASAVSLNPSGSTESAALAVAGGQQVGYIYSFQHAALWAGTAASAVDLHPTGYTSSQARATNGVQQAGFGWVNNAAQIPHRHALVWSGSAASAVDLNQFMPLGYTDAAATGIDAAGNVVGWASTSSPNNSASVHAVMWIPSDAPMNFAQSIAAAQSVIGAGDSVQATVTLNQPAPAGGAFVRLAGVVSAVSSAAPSPLTFSMPANVFVPEGDTSVSFNVTTAATSLAGFTHTLPLDIQASYGDTTQTVTVAVTPSLSLSTFGVAPGNVTGGSAVTGTITLSAPAPAGGALIQLSSNSAAALVPANVFVPAGQSTASFGVQTNTVAAFTNVTLTATYNGALASIRTASFLVAPPPVSVDTVAIQKADYVVSKKQLVVQASSTSQTALLTVTNTATGEVIGALTNKGAGSYSGTFAWPTAPQNITVTSDLTGTSSRAVTLK